MDEIKRKWNLLFNFQRTRKCSLNLGKRVSVINAEGPPVPIPNTEVKLCSGENTLRATAREDSSMLTPGKRQSSPENLKKIRDPTHGGVAQLGEHLPCKQGVKGSNPFISTTYFLREER